MSIPYWYFTTFQFGSIMFIRMYAALYNYFGG